MKKYLLLGLITAFVLFAIMTITRETKERGTDILEARCSGCHSVDKSKSQKKTREQWETLVTQMIKIGAELTPKEKKILVDYLSETYKP